VNPARCRSSVPPLAIGSDVWPGAAKLMEELGELQQVFGKLIAYPDVLHPDGSDLAARLAEEIADVMAATSFFLDHNDLPEGIESRTRAKVGRFNGWHDAERRAA